MQDWRQQQDNELSNDEHHHVHEPVARKFEAIADLVDARLAKPFDTAVPLRAECRAPSRLPPYPLSVKRP
jgi:hypothetical protein